MEPDQGCGHVCPDLVPYLLDFSGDVQLESHQREREVALRFTEQIKVHMEIPAVI